MAGKNRTGLIDQYGVGPDPLDVLHQAGDLSFGMFPRVVPEGLELGNRTPDNLVRWPSRR
jgi:hypothetical protein